LLHNNVVLGVMILDSQLTTHAFTEKDLALFETVASQAAVAVQNTLFAKKLEQEAITRERFRRLLSPAIAEQVLSGLVEVKKGGELRETTILFADIRGFTSMSESREPQLVVDALNEYFERMVDIVFRYEGTLDKFIGDEIMALFGSPVAHPDDPIRAVRTALEMQEALATLNERHEDQGIPPFRIGIGINTGEVVAGYIGSSQALEYTVIGDPVNTGSRLCSLAKPGQTLVSEGTVHELGNHFEIRELPPAQVKGKAQPIRVFEVLGHAGSE
jgi:adenylate cyclase